MTLTAMIFSGRKIELFNPSARIENGEDRYQVVEDARQYQKEGRLFCPHCYDRLRKKYPVCYRNTESKRVHFYHPKYDNESTECKNWSGESEKHKSAKAAIYRYLQVVEGIADLNLYQEFALRDSDVPMRQPDVYAIFPNGSTLAIEVQVSPITSLQISDRTYDIKNHGVDDVAWYLAGKNYNRENREWCERNAIGCYHLWFEDGDAAKPKWKKAELLSVEDPKNFADTEDACTQGARIKPAKDSKIRVGDRVTGVEGRDSHGWTGIVKKIDTLETGVLYYRVYWEERANSTESLIAKAPIIGMLAEQIRKL